jgi:alanine dehydrogenase
MKIGVPTETKTEESRVAMTPAGVHDLVAAGHTVLVQAGAGDGSRVPDAEFADAGATIVADAATAWGDADLVCKVKEPQPTEFEHLRPGLVLFTYLHLAAYPAVAAALRERRVTAIAYETVQDAQGRLPLLAPMSEIAGRMSIQVGAHFLEREAGGRGILLGGCPGVEPANVVIVGAGMAGANAASIARGMEADVTIFDLNLDRLRAFDAIHRGAIKTRVANSLDIARAALDADLVVGAVLLPGAKAPRVLTRETVAKMKTGAVLVDISIDQGGCFETSHMTTHSDPTYVVDGVVHYCVGNMPGAVPRTSTYALTNVTLPYVVAIADHGLEAAVRADDALARGVNVYDGAITTDGVAAAHTLEAAPLSSLIGGAG